MGFCCASKLDRKACEVVDPIAERPPIDIALEVKQTEPIIEFLNYQYTNLTERSLDIPGGESGGPNCTLGSPRIVYERYSAAFSILMATKRCMIPVRAIRTRAGVVMRLINIRFPD